MIYDIQLYQNLIFIQTKGRRRQVGWFPATYVKVLAGGRMSGRNTPLSSSKINLHETVIGKSFVKTLTRVTETLPLFCRQSASTLPLQSTQRWRAKLWARRYHQCSVKRWAGLVARRVEWHYRPLPQQLRANFCIVR